MITYRIGNTTTHVRQWFFPDGCVGTNINVGQQPVDCGRFDIVVTVKFGGFDQSGEAPYRKYSINDDIMALAFTVDALKRQYPLASLHLDMPYVPYARQDRVCSPGEAHQLKVIANLINGMGFATVTSVDAHSTVSNGVFDRFYTLDQISVFSKIKTNWSEVYIVAPDQGATKKAEAFAKAVKAAGVITCAKVREMSTGKILGLRVLDDMPFSSVNSEFLVLDDLCDGGRTFIEVAKALKGHDLGKLELAVTHGLFSKGVGVVKDFYDEIYTTDSVISDKTGAKVLDLD